MLVDELRELTNNAKQYQEEYEEIVSELEYDSPITYDLIEW